jgi:hypothetical protein
MKGITTTGKVEKHGNMRRQHCPMAEPMIKDTLKETETSGDIHQILSQRRGTRGNIHSSKNGPSQRIPPWLHPPQPVLPPTQHGVAILKGPTALLGQLM